MGSCRYPGTPVEAEQADAVFAGMLSRLTTDDLDMVFFVGDQIYADAYNDVFDNGVWRDRYRGSYRAAFRSEKLKELLRSLPIHFAMDDHEIVDDWSGGAGPGASSPRGLGGPQTLTYAGLTQDQLDFARKAARLHMSSAREARGVGAAPQPAPGSMWYALDHAGEVNFPCFVLDTRSERTLREVGLHGNANTLPPMLSPGGQLAAFRQWLDDAHAQMPDRPKFVFAGQVLAPIPRDLVAHPNAFRTCDSFLGYPGTLRAVIEHIVANGIPQRRLRGRRPAPLLRGRADARGQRRGGSGLADRGVRPVRPRALRQLASRALRVVRRAGGARTARQLGEDDLHRAAAHGQPFALRAGARRESRGRVDDRHHGPREGRRPAPGEKPVRQQRDDVEVQLA